MAHRVLVVVAVLLSAGPAFAQLGMKLRQEGDRLYLDHPTIIRSDWAHAPSVPAAPKAPEWGRTHLPANPPPDFSLYAETSRVRVTKMFGPARYLMLHYSSGTGTVEPVEFKNGTTLADEAWKAVELAPDWIKVEMIANLALVPLLRQQELAKLMAAVEDPRYLDEIAFLIANMTPEDLTHESFRPAFITDQVSAIYAADPQLDYVQIKETGEPGEGDYWTTVVYTYMDNGVEKQWELPKEHYYWWIVHPRLDGEYQIDIKPETGKPAPYPDGLPYKEYILWPPQEGMKSYVHHYIFRDAPPYEKYDGLQYVPYESLQGWNPSQQGFFKDFSRNPLLLTMDAQGRPTTIEFKVKPKGIVLATTLLVEKAWADGKSELLRNMLRYGAGNVVIPTEFKHVVVMEQPPFGQEGIIEAVLDEFDVNYEVVDSTWLYDADLADVRKIIVPSDQPLAVYQALADNRDKLDAWITQQWNILELHAAVTDKADDWSGLLMPGEFTAQGVAADKSDEVLHEGQPPLARVVPGTKYVWDLQKAALPGERLLDPDTHAIDKLLWWAAQNIFDSAVDWNEKHTWIFAERSSDAVRVLYDHFGNCGENQDIVTSVSRTALVATANSSNGCEDHVWSEFSFLDSWHTFQIGWSEGGADIDSPGISSGKKWGGGKNISFVTAYRGDGAAINRTDYYTYTGDLTVKVVDKNGKPIQGAEVVLLTESLYKEGDSYPLMVGRWDITGQDGKVTVQLGANIEDPISNCKNLDLNLNCNNYYIKVLTSIGNYPAEDNKVDLALEDIHAVKGFDEEITVTIAGEHALHVPQGTSELTQTEQPSRLVRFQAAMLTELACGIGLMAGTYCDVFSDGLLDFYLLDQDGFDSLIQGKPFTALAMQESFGPDFDVAFEPPHFGDWYFILAHQHNLEHIQLLDAAFTVLDRSQQPVEPEPAEDVDTKDVPVPSEDVTAAPDEAQPAGDAAAADGVENETASGGGGGCATHSRGPSASALLIIALALALAAARRHAAARR